MIGSIKEDACFEILQDQVYFLDIKTKCQEIRPDPPSEFIKK